MYSWALLGKTGGGSVVCVKGGREGGRERCVCEGREEGRSVVSGGSVVSGIHGTTSKQD